MSPKTQRLKSATTDAGKTSGDKSGEAEAAAAGGERGADTSVSSVALATAASRSLLASFSSFFALRYALWAYHTPATLRSH
jgi:hypothetical protein